MALRDNPADVLQAFGALEEALVGTEHEPLLTALVAAVADDTTAVELRQEVAFRDAEIERLSTSSACALLEWDGAMPDLRVVEEEHGATPTFMIVADYGWAQRILCGGSYQQDADAILAALNEAKSRCT